MLASGSPRRRALLARVRRRFSIRESGVPEPVPRRPVKARFYVLRSATRKARAVARRVPRGWVLGADTEVVRRGRVFGKPRDAADAARMLTDLSGRWHQVFTGLALIERPSNRLWTAAARTDVKIRALSPAAIARHAQTNHDKAGAYAAQARGNPFVEKHRGPYDNIVGLPLAALRALLRRAEKTKNPNFSVGARTARSEAVDFSTKKAKSMQGHRKNFLRKKKPDIAPRIPRSK